MYMNRLLLGMMLPLVLLAGSSCTDDDEYTQGQWMKRSGFEAEPRAYACSFTIDEKGYLCGGFRGANKEYMNDLWVYDMNNNNWEQLANMPTVGRKYATGFALNGKGYVTTGSVKDGSYSNYVADTWEYDPVSDSWTQKDDYKGGPRDGALAFVIGGYAYVGTGYNEDTQGITRTSIVSIPMRQPARSGRKMPVTVEDPKSVPMVRLSSSTMWLTCVAARTTVPI